MQHGGLELDHVNPLDVRQLCQPAGGAAAAEAHHERMFDRLRVDQRTQETAHHLGALVGHRSAIALAVDEKRRIIERIKRDAALAPVS